MSQIKIIEIIILTFAVIAPKTSLAECEVYYTGEAAQIFGSGGRGNFATCSQCQAYINSTPGFERTHSYCSETDTPFQHAFFVRPLSGTIGYGPGVRQPPRSARRFHSLHQKT